MIRALCIGGSRISARKRATLKLYEPHVELEDIEPRIWRTILAPRSIKLPKLHAILELVMGWRIDSHLDAFQFGDTVYLDEKTTTREGALRDSRQLPS